MVSWAFLIESVKGMKKFRTFALIFLAFLIYSVVLHFLATDRVNARKSIKLLLRPLLTDSSTEVTVEYYKGGKLYERKDIQDNQGSVRLLSKYLSKYVIEGSKIDKLPCNKSNLIRVKLEGSESKCILDFPTTEHACRICIFKDVIYGHARKYKLTKRGGREICLILEP